ncbi:MAG TPA: AraC family transcriptional regulator [Hyphomicrobiaceae bacterium]|nr:AraC family transcriptional regulator [Hyphomicrobiaceae bacterium]
MTEKPGLPAETPDVLSDMLRAVRLTGAVFFSGRYTAPYGIRSTKRFDPSMPAAHLRHISVFHLLTAGTCMFESASGSQRRLTAGDLLLIPFAGEHQFWEGDDVRIVPVENTVRQGHHPGLWTSDHGGSGPETRLVCGLLESSEFLAMPLFRTLPEFVIARPGDFKAGELVVATVRDIMALVDAASPGADIMLGRMMELLFIEMLRRHASSLPQDSRGLLAAMNDPVVGQALKLVHAEPARHWTVDSLARKTGASRTVLAERFNAFLGRPPIDYVIGWRIQLAAERLRNGRDPIATIAADVGYESEAAFGRAFKRVTGISPGRWRNGAGDSPDLMPLQFKTPLGPVADDAAVE